MVIKHEVTPEMYSPNTGTKIPRKIWKVREHERASY